MSCAAMAPMRAAPSVFRSVSLATPHWDAAMASGDHDHADDTSASIAGCTTVADAAHFHPTAVMIAQAAVHAVKWHSGVPSDSVTVTVEDGWFVLRYDPKPS